MSHVKISTITILKTRLVKNINTRNITATFSHESCHDMDVEDADIKTFVRNAIRVTKDDIGIIEQPLNIYPSHKIWCNDKFEWQIDPVLFTSIKNLLDKRRDTG